MFIVDLSSLHLFRRCNDLMLEVFHGGRGRRFVKGNSSISCIYAIGFISEGIWWMHCESTVVQID